MNLNDLKGLGVAMVTPFNADGAIDFNGLEKLTNFLIDEGVNYLVVQGTTGESPVLSHAEKQAVLDKVIEINNGRLPVVFGIGGNNTLSVGEGFKTFNLNGVSAILSASPYYNKPTQEGIYQHYKHLNDQSNLPIIVYNVPGRTSSNILPETTLRMAHDLENIVAIKEASGNMEQIMHLIQHKPENFLVISGDDGITMPLIAAGADGVISVIGNGFPKEFSEMVAAGLNDNNKLARSLHYKLLTITPLLFQEGNPAGIKEVLAHKGIIKNHLRLPLVNVSESLKNKLIDETRNISN